MKHIFDEVSNECSKLTTIAYSTSFSLGIRVLEKKLHHPIYGIYGFVRFADEIVDTFHNYNKFQLFEDFKKDTYKAIENKISLNPILNSFQKVVNDYNIDLKLIDTFLESMEMDLQPQVYDTKKYNLYILGSAEVVGLMCLQVFVDGDKKSFEKLKPYAMSLGSAFQKINFLRDANADFEELGRTYFPNIDMHNFSELDKLKIEEDIEEDFKKALVGIKMLKSGSRGGVYLAYVYYYNLFRKIQDLPSSRVLDERVRVANSNKFFLMCQSIVKNQFNWI
ncbi:phytoene/squalene synthase family protein [Flavobacteriales bacterium]|nr:phytoene/squalene synthase family protein [Flavobacteriales bacterium]